jgi:hypothetical protein
MSWAIQLVIALAIFAAGAAGGVRWHAGQDAIAAQEQARVDGIERQRRAELVDSSAVKLEHKKEQLRTEFVEIERVVNRVVEKPIYNNACFDDDGVRELNAAIRAAAHPGVSAPAVPESRPAR